MMSRVAIWLLASGALVMSASALAYETRTNCLPTAPQSIRWMLTTAPSGPVWPVATSGLDYAGGQPPVDAPLTLTLWRHPCSTMDAQVLLTITPGDGRPALPAVSVYQGGATRSVNLVINDPTLNPPDLLMAASAVTGAVTAVVDSQTANPFNPNAALRVFIQPYQAPGVFGATLTVDVPVYDPTQYQASAFAVGPGITGNWFNRNQSGQGFSIEVLPDDQMLAEWYVFAPGGGPVWIVATGPIVGNSAVLQAFQVIGIGGRFPPNFDPTQVQDHAWGTLSFTFTDCNTGEASWQPTASGYTSGSMTIVRLTQPAGLTCP